MKPTKCQRMGGTHQICASFTKSQHPLNKCQVSCIPSMPTWQVTHRQYDIAARSLVFTLLSSPERGARDMTDHSALDLASISLSRHQQSL